MQHIEMLVVNILYLLALINPISKVAILAGIAEEQDQRHFRSLAIKSSLVAAAILLITMLVGSFLLHSVFRVNLYALQFAGGTVVFWMGMNALRRGVFFEQNVQARFEDMALVPLACPMIAGPATIAACVGLPASTGNYIFAGIAIGVAVGINHIVMITSGSIRAALTRFNILGALIRITGLIVMTIGAQMVFDGILIWAKANF